MARISPLVLQRPRQHLADLFAQKLGGKQSFSIEAAESGLHQTCLRWELIRAWGEAAADPGARVAT